MTLFSIAVCCLYNSKSQQKTEGYFAHTEMSTQGDSSIPFEISKEQQNFRLLELPPSLLASLASKDPPKCAFYLKYAGSKMGIVLTCLRVCG